MDLLFSCRNCIHNAGQSLNVGRDGGFCLKHDSILRDPSKTTCKYLHRKDLPLFVVDEGIREHAAEFAAFPGLVNLLTKEPIGRSHYSEKYAWERKTFDPVTHSIAQYHKSERAWIVIQSMASGVDGRRSIAYSSLVRRYVATCETWRSSYRLFLAFIQEIASTPLFQDKDILQVADEPIEETKNQALWDVVFARISAVQEYGWHAGLEDMMWATDQLNGALSEFNWSNLSRELEDNRGRWTDEIIEHARREGEFFPTPTPEAIPTNPGLEEP
jgi:hypothetical protein